MSSTCCRTTGVGVCGATIHVIGEVRSTESGAAHSRAVVLATGGLGQIYASTTNPPVATGDGMAIALRAGAVMADIEFVQFHPTVLFLGDDSTGQQPLISEAVRGEGLRSSSTSTACGSCTGSPWPIWPPAMSSAVPSCGKWPPLGPTTCSSTSATSARSSSSGAFRRSSPPAVSGFDPATTLLPVAPAQHYASGGIRTDLDGRSSLEGLYACGECSCTGVHGANRLASNSLLEGLVFAHRIAEDIAERFARGELPPVAPAPAPTAPDTVLVRSAHRKAIQHAMTAGSGVVRSAPSLAATAEASPVSPMPPTGSRAGPTRGDEQPVALGPVAHPRCRVARRDPRWARAQ